jgi:4-amino-4-deoxy-L-arabinose transferase-like glycosyltransferase
MCLTDATMMVFLMLAQMCLMAMYLGYFRWWSVLVLFLGLGFAGLTKGPVALVPTAFTLIALAILDYERLWQLIRPNRSESWERIIHTLLIVLGGLVVTVGVSAPWLYMLHDRAPEWLPRTLNMAGQHLNTPLEGHTGPFGYYMLLVWGTFFPWSLFIPTAVYVAWKQRHVPQTRFAIAAFLGPWLFFERMHTKLPHYVLPTFPFLAFMVADALVRCTRAQYLELYKPRFIIASLIWAVIIGLLGSAPWLMALPRYELGPQPWLPMIALSIAAYIFTLGVWWWFQHRRPFIAAAWMGGAFIGFIALFYGWYLPQAKFVHLSSEVAQIIIKNDGGADKLPTPGDVISLVYSDGKHAIGYQEPTLAFYQGGSLRYKEEDNYLVKTPPSEWPRIMVLTSEIWKRTPEDVQGKLDILGKARGLAYADGGQIYDVYVVRPKWQ